MSKATTEWNICPVSHGMIHNPVSTLNAACCSVPYLTSEHALVLTNGVTTLPGTPNIVGMSQLRSKTKERRFRSIVRCVSDNHFRERLSRSCRYLFERNSHGVDCSCMPIVVARSPLADCCNVTIVRLQKISLESIRLRIVV